MAKMTVVIIAVVALLVGLFGGYLYEKGKVTSSMMMQADLQKKLDAEKMTNEKLMQESQTQMKSEGTMMPEKEDTMMKTASPTDVMRK